MSILTLEREDEMWITLTKFLKTCHKLTKIHISNIMAKNAKEENININKILKSPPDSNCVG